MRAMRAEQFSGYEGLKLVDLPKPAVSDGKVLLRITATGVTPLEHTILSGHVPPAKAPLVLGSEGAGVVEEGGGMDFPVGSRVMFTGTYGVWFSGRQNRAGASDRRIGRQRCDAIGACLGSRTDSIGLVTSKP